MNSFKKVFFSSFFFLSSCFFVFPDTPADDNSAVLIEVSDVFADEIQFDKQDNAKDLADSDEALEDDIDSLFNDAEDVEEAVVTQEEKAGTDYNIQLGTIKLPIEVSGFLNTEMGAAYTREQSENDATFYFDFKNYIYFTTRPDKYIALKGVLKTSMPKDDADVESNNLLYLYEMYFDYLFLNRIYFTGGKKQSVWGNIRLFSNSDDYENDRDALYTNILYDSRDYISGIIKIPFKNNTFTALGMYNEQVSSNSPGTKDMSLAASLEFILFNTSFNIFARRFPLNYGADSENAQNPIAGLELKGSLFGFDVYDQCMTRIADGNRIKDIFTSKFSDKTSLDEVINTCGIYRLWDNFKPYIGFNFEYQNIYRPAPKSSETYFTNRFAFEYGMAKLGKYKNLKLAFQWNHNLTDKSGMVKSGVIFSRILAHCDWRNGIKYEYDKKSKAFNQYKLTIGSYVTINLAY